MEEIAKNSWDFIVYKEDGKYIMSVVFHASAMDYSRKFYIDEKDALMELDDLKKLSERIRNNYEAYKHNEIQEG